MFGICIEASHQRGLGHLFRMLNFSDLLAQRGIPFRLFMNADQDAEIIVQQAGVPYETVLSNDIGWQQQVIEEHELSLWIDDKLDTTIAHAKAIASCGLQRITFDDRGEGASLAALNVAALCFGPSAERLKGKHILVGPRYLILNQEIGRYRRIRKHLESIVVSMGGTDTYGVTVQVAKQLKAEGKHATLILGPGFRHEAELGRVLDDGFVVKRNVPSLAEEFSHHDLAITGGGITPFEANAAGLPCVVIANEDFEIPVGLSIEALGGAVFAGHYSNFSLDCLATDMPLQQLSQAAMNEIDLDGAARVLEAIEGLA